MRHETALCNVLKEAGIRRSVRARIEKIIDADDYIGLTSDDIAGALISWANARADRAHEQGIQFASPPWYDPHQQWLFEGGHQ